MARRPTLRPAAPTPGGVGGRRVSSRSSAGASGPAHAPGARLDDSPHAHRFPGPGSSPTSCLRSRGRAAGRARAGALLDQLLLRPAHRVRVTAPDVAVGRASTRAWRRRCAATRPARPGPEGRAPRDDRSTIGYRRPARPETGPTADLSRVRRPRLALSLPTPRSRPTGRRPFVLALRLDGAARSRPSPRSSGSSAGRSRSSRSPCSDRRQPDDKLPGAARPAAVHVRVGRGTASTSGYNGTSSRRCRRCRARIAAAAPSRTPRAAAGSGSGDRSVLGLFVRPG